MQDTTKLRKRGMIVDGREGKEREGKGRGGGVDIRWVLSSLLCINGNILFPSIKVYHLSTCLNTLFT